MASAIYRAVKEYKLDFEKENGVYDYRKESVKSYNANKSSNTDNKTVIGNLVFRVQFYTSPNKLQFNEKRFKSIPDMFVYEHNGVFKYTSGNYTNLKDAENHKKTVRDKGFNDAFTIVFYKGSRISMEQAKKLLNEK